MTDLLPCPFCGGKPEVIRCSVHCNSPFCEAQPFTAGQSKTEAIAAWNKRAALTEALQVPAVLSDEQIAEIAERMEATDPTATFWRDFARAVLAASAPVTQPSEPVGVPGPAHNDHPMRHWDRTCPACNPGVETSDGGQQK